MVTSKEHIGSRSDYINALALSRSQAENHGRFNNPLPKHNSERPNRLQPALIPDLRFEPTYLARLAVAGTGFQTVVWVTLRDQVISPLIQGALWCVACHAQGDSMTYLVQGCRIHVHTTLATPPYQLAVSGPYSTACKGR